MGVDFDYEFHVHQRDARRFLTAVVELCDPSEPRWTNVLLPDGTSVELPGTHHVAGGATVELPDPSGPDFDLSLCFPLDDPLRAYQDETGSDGSRVVLGYIYLSVSDAFAVLPEHWRFCFMPATSSQSRLFLASPSIRETFAALALSTGTSLCLLDSELGGPKIIVTALGHRVSTQVPGPCLLWNPRGHGVEAFEELSSRLAGQPYRPERIVGPEHLGHTAVIDSLADYSQLPRHLWNR